MMASIMEITCFTDLKGSTAFTEAYGNRAAWPYLQDHLRVTRLLTIASGGTYRKATGDGHLVSFNDVESALTFAARLQQYYDTQPCLEQRLLAFRVGLSHGAAIEYDNDVFGTNPNTAARVEQAGAPNEVYVNERIVDLAREIWGLADTGRYFAALGTHDLKGISDPLRTLLSRFLWREYLAENPDRSLSQLVHDFLFAANIELSNVSRADLNTPGLIIWPVVPRQIVTAIHRAQAEIIRLLCMLGWQVKILVADCGVKIPADPRFSDSFRQRLMRYMTYRKMRGITSELMQVLYQPTEPGYENILGKFRQIAEKLTLQDLLDINNKRYTQDIQQEILSSATLDCLRPALTAAAVLFLSEAEASKCIVVSGADERIQWETMYRIGARDKVGVLMNPILRMDANYQTRQKSDGPIWNSREQLAMGMDGANLAWWVFRLHAILPAFPSTSIDIDGTTISLRDWMDEDAIPTGLRRDSLADRVWEILDPNVPAAR